MPNRLKPLNLVDFTGGVNLRSEVFQLQDNEVPELLNLEVDPRGGLNTRKGWEVSGSTPVVDDVGVEAYLNPATGPITTVDTADMAITGAVRFTVDVQIDSIPTGAWPNWVTKQGDYTEFAIFMNTTDTATWFLTANATKTGVVYCSIAPVTPLGRHTFGIEVTPGSANFVAIVDGVRTPQTAAEPLGLPNMTDPVVIGGYEPPQRIYSAQMADVATGQRIWRFDANEYPGTGTSYVDPRSRTWTLGTGTTITPGITPTKWDPRNALRHRKSSNVPFNYIASDGHIYGQQADVWTDLSAAAKADPHDADFVSWGDVVIAVQGIGTGAGTALKIDGTSVTSLTASGAANWQNDYTNPGATDTCPQAEVVAAHSGYLFVASTIEDGTQRWTRLRWSHPNNPYRWAEPDYIDLLEGGSRITAIISFSDRLLIFKQDSVWALYGYDADSWELANISRTIGCWSQQTVARSEGNVYFMSWPHGVFGYSEKANIEELSTQIRPVFQDRQMDPADIDNSWVGWVGRRLWVSLPWNGKTPPPSIAMTSFVYDPVLGSWTVFRGADDCVPGPYIERADLDRDNNQLAVSNRFPYTILLDSHTELAQDECRPGLSMPFPTRMRTRWLDAGAPTWKKSWRRPDFLLRALTIDSTINCQVFHDFDNHNAQRSFTVGYTPENVVAVFGGFTYGDGTLWGGSDQTSSVERGGTMGRAGVVQLLVYGFDSVVWGLNGIVFKFIPRRFR